MACHPKLRQFHKTPTSTSKLADTYALPSSERICSDGDARRNHGRELEFGVRSMLDMTLFGPRVKGVILL